MPIDHSVGMHWTADLGTRWMLFGAGQLVPWTFMAWIKVNTLASRAGLMALGRSGDNLIHTLRVETDGTLRMTHKDNGATNRNFDILGAGGIAVGNWYHVACAVYPGAAANSLCVQGWVNGHQRNVGQITLSGGIGTPTLFRVFAFSDNLGSYLNGTLGYLRVFWNKMLNTGQVQREMVRHRVRPELAPFCLVDAPFDPKSSDPFANYATALARSEFTGADSAAWTLGQNPPLLSGRRAA